MESNIDELIGQYTEEMQRRYEEAVESGISKREDTVSYKSQSSAGISSAETQTKPQSLKTIVYAPLADSKIAP